jgi:hypothetical protein
MQNILQTKRPTNAAWSCGHLGNALARDRKPTGAPGWGRQAGSRPHCWQSRSVAIGLCHAVIMLASSATCTMDHLRFSQYLHHCLLQVPYDGTKNIRKAGCTVYCFINHTVRVICMRIMDEFVAYNGQFAEPQTAEALCAADRLLGQLPAETSTLACRMHVSLIYAPPKDIIST